MDSERGVRVTVVDRTEDGFDGEAKVLEHILHHLGRDVRRIYLNVGQKDLLLLVGGISLHDGVEYQVHVLDLREVRPLVKRHAAHHAVEGRRTLLLQWVNVLTCPTPPHTWRV